MGKQRFGYLLLAFMLIAQQANSEVLNDFKKRIFKFSNLKPGN